MMQIKQSIFLVAWILIWSSDSVESNNGKQGLKGINLFSLLNRHSNRCSNSKQQVSVKHGNVWIFKNLVNFLALSFKP